MYKLLKLRETFAKIWSLHFIFLCPLLPLSSSESHGYLLDFFLQLLMIPPAFSLLLLKFIPHIPVFLKCGLNCLEEMPQFTFYCKFPILPMLLCFSLSCHSHFHFQMEDHSFERAPNALVRGRCQGLRKTQNLGTFSQLGWSWGMPHFPGGRTNRERHRPFQSHYLKDLFTDHEWDCCVGRECALRDPATPRDP